MKIKKQILIICLISFTVINLFAQTQKKEITLAGVYLTLADFKINKLTYDIDCGTEKQKIKLHDFFTKPYIDVYYKDQKHTLQKKDVYGYRDCHNNTYRFFMNEEYKIEEVRSITIYSLQESAPSGKSFRWINVYYFSSTPDDEIKPLTIENLKFAFPDNHKFHDTLNETFKDNVSVSEYDTFHKMFKVNHTYEMSLK